MFLFTFQFVTVLNYTIYEFMQLLKFQVIMKVIRKTIHLYHTEFLNCSSSKHLDVEKVKSRNDLMDPSNSVPLTEWLNNKP